MIPEKIRDYSCIKEMLFCQGIFTSFGITEDDDVEEERTGEYREVQQRGKLWVSNRRKKI